MDDIQEYSFKLKLEGENEIPAKILCKLLSNLTLVADKTKPNEAEQISYMVRATSPGSFDIVFNVIAAVAQQAFVGNGELINLAKGSIQAILELLKLKSFLKGEKPARVVEKNGCVEVTNNNGTVNNFYINGDYINNQQVDKGLMGIGNALHTSSIPNMVVMDEEETELLKISRDEYPYIQQPMADMNTEKIYENTVDVEFTVKKPDLQGKSKWEIILEGRCIHASIEDEEWIKNVQAGYISVNAQQIIKAKMKVTQKGDRYGIPIVGSEKYYVLEVYDNYTRKEYSQIEL